MRQMRRCRAGMVQASLSRFGVPRPSSAAPARWTSPRSKPLALFWRSLSCRVIDHVNKVDGSLEHLFADSDDLAMLRVLKSATQPGATTVVGWAQELVGTTNAQWARRLRRRGASMGSSRRKR
jgi:hypothetical protein